MPQQGLTLAWLVLILDTQLCIFKYVDRYLDYGLSLIDLMFWHGSCRSNIVCLNRYMYCYAFNLMLCVVEYIIRILRSLMT